MAWDYPFFIIATFVAALAVAWWLIRIAGPRRRAVAFECKVCGRAHRGVTPREWRYCPHCGAPRNATSLKDVPSKRRSVVDL